MADERLAGKRVLITGASSGIGAATARLFVAEGARVALVARQSDPLAELAASLGPGAPAIQCDVTDSDQVTVAVDRASEELDGLDVVVSSAGVAMPIALEELGPEAWRETVDVNLSGSFYVCRETGLRMREAGGGVIVNLGSELSVMGMRGYVAYCASKAGVIGLTRALADELAPSVRVNAVCPGPVDTPMLQGEFEALGNVDQARKETLERVPLGRLATAEEVARAIVFLAADAPYATATTLELDGGTTAV